MKSATAVPPTPKRGKIFTNGGSQAVRVPKEFKFDSTEVEIWKEGDVVLMRAVKKREWPKGFFESIHISDPAFKRQPQGKMPPAVKL